MYHTSIFSLLIALWRNAFAHTFRKETCRPASEPHVTARVGARSLQEAMPLAAKWPMLRGRLFFVFRALLI